MLRPALLLPLLGFRSGRLLTPRCGLRPLGRRLGPATGRSGAYPDGTLTRRLGGARTCLLRTSFRTRHRAWTLTPGPVSCAPAATSVPSLPAQDLTPVRS